MNNQEAIDALLALHVPVRLWRGLGHDLIRCNVCKVDWPCATRRILDETSAALAASSEHTLNPCDRDSQP